MLGFASSLTIQMAAFMDFIFERLKDKNPDGSLQIMFVSRYRLFTDN